MNQFVDVSSANIENLQYSITLLEKESITKFISFIEEEITCEDFIDFAMIRSRNIKKDDITSITIEVDLYNKKIRIVFINEFLSDVNIEYNNIVDMFPNKEVYGMVKKFDFYVGFAFASNNKNCNLFVTDAKLHDSESFFGICNISEISFAMPIK